jgi:hypothetical protein
MGSLTSLEASRTSDAGPSTTRLLRAIRADDLATLDAPALAEALDYLQSVVAFGTRRLATLATTAIAPAAPAEPPPAELLDIKTVARLTGRSVSWIEHHPDVIPGRRQTRRGARKRWIKADVVRWVSSGGW